MQYTFDELINLLCDGDAENDHIRALIDMETLTAWCNDYTE